MAKVAVTESHLEDIADAIRAKTGLSTTYKPSEMAAAISAIPSGGGIIPTGTLNITANDTYDVTIYANASVNVPQTTITQLNVSSNGTYTAPSGTAYSPVVVSVSGGGGTINNQDKSTDPTEAVQIISYDSGYTGLNTVTVNAISSDYIGSNITQRSSTDLTVSGNTITAPAGFYSTSASKAVANMTLPTSAASSATSGYTSKATISRSTSAQYINIPPGYNPSGGYYTISATPNGTVTAPSSISGTSATVSTGTNTLTLSKTVSVTPSVTTEGYISSGTAGNSTVSLTASVTVNPTPTASGATVTIPAGYYSSQTTKSVTSGSATGPSSLSGTSATVSTGTNTLTLTKTGVTTTPTVSAGYVSSATSSSATVTLTASVTTKAAETIHPSTSDQSIAASTYLTGAQTIKAVTTNNLTAENIKSGVTVTVGDSTDSDCIASILGTYTGGGSGSSKFVTGTITIGTTTGAAETHSIPYTGSGYPIAFICWVKGGAYASGSDWYNLIQRYAVGVWGCVKSNTASTPSYGTSGSENQGVSWAIYKNSTSSSTSYTRTSAVNANIFSSSNANSTATTNIRFKSKTSISVYVASSSYGLKSGYDYDYIALYSS